jgi:hypothetical protein
LPQWQSRSFATGVTDLEGDAGTAGVRAGPRSPGRRRRPAGRSSASAGCAPRGRRRAGARRGRPGWRRCRRSAAAAVPSEASRPASTVRAGTALGQYRLWAASAAPSLPTDEGQRHPDPAQGRVAGRGRAAPDRRPDRAGPPASADRAAGPR